MSSKRIMPLVSVSVLAMASALYAQDTNTPTTLTLDTVYIIAEGQDNVEATGGTVIDQDELERLQPTNTSELFQRESSVTVSGGGGPSKRIHVLGMEQSALAVSVDGVPQVATSWHHTGSNVIDPVFLKRVEVEAGAAAADSGFAAAAGAIRYETVGAQDMLEDGQTDGGRAALSWGSNGRGVSGSLAGYGKHGGFDWFVMAHAADGDNYEDGDGNEILGTEPASRNVLAKFGYEFDDHRIELGYESSRDDGERLVKAIMDLTGDEVFALKSNRDTVQLRYTSTNPTDNWDPEVSLYLSQFEYWRPNYYPGVTNGNMVLNEDMFGGKVQNTFATQIGSITAGVDFGDHDYKVDNYGNVSPRIRNFSTTQIGVFTQGRFDFNNGVTLSTGFRFDGHRFTDWNGERISDSGASANATIAYRFNESVEVFAGASKTWLGYMIGDYAYLHARNDSFYTSPDFKPAEAKNIKLGANFGGDNWQAGVTLFDTRIEGAPNYSAQDSAGVSMLDNAEEEYRSKGFTLNASYDFGTTRVGGTVTKADVEIGDNSALPNSSLFMPVGDMATLYVDHDIAAADMTVGASLKWAGKIKDAYASESGFYDQPSYTVVNAYAEWKPEAYKNVSVRLGVDNLLDERYSERGGFAQQENPRRGLIEPVYAPGRTFTLGTAIKF